MSALIPIHQQMIGSETIQTVNAKELYEFLGVKQRFGDWITKRIQQYQFEESLDFTRYYNSSNGNPNPQIDYFVSMNMAKELSMVEKTSKGKEARKYFLECERQVTGSHKILDPVEKYPELIAIRELLLATAEARDQAAEALRVADIADARAVRAETKADMALTDAHRMTLEEFVIKNGLLRQFPESRWTLYAKWLGHFCQQYGLATLKVSVVGKAWREEKAYPLEALAALQRYELHKPRQVTLVHKTTGKDGAHGEYSLHPA